MELEAAWVEHDGPDGPVSAYLARPLAATASIPGVLVIQEIWGVDGHIQDLARRFATAGYVALAADLYSAGGGRPPELSFERVEAGKQFLNTIPVPRWMEVIGDPDERAEALSSLPEEQAREINATLGTLFGGAGHGTERNVAILRCAFAYLRAHPACEGSAIGSIGYCMGGGLSALLAAAEPELAAAVINYGGSPPADRATEIRCPIRGFYGQDDPRIVSTLGEFGQVLSEAGVDHELRVYPDTGHAFFNDGRPSYRHRAARDTWARTLQFFADTLNPVAPV